MTDANEQHLGDGLYASFDGFQLRLRAPRENGDHVVYLEDWVYRALKRFMREEAESWEPGEQREHAQ